MEKRFVHLGKLEPIEWIAAVIVGRETDFIADKILIGPGNIEANRRLARRVSAACNMDSHMRKQGMWRTAYVKTPGGHAHCVFDGDRLAAVGRGCSAESTAGHAWSILMNQLPDDCEAFDDPKDDLERQGYSIAVERPKVKSAPRPVSKPQVNVRSQYVDDGYDPFDC